MMTTNEFTHEELGQWNYLLGPLVLESRNPNEGIGSEPTKKTRYQYSICNGAVMRRHLPADTDCWRDPATGKMSRRPPLWEEMTGDIIWPLLIDWLNQLLLPNPWSAGGSAAQDQFTGETVTMQTMRSRIEVTGTSWPQIVPCPHCYDAIVWAEACFVPGYRICRGCHRHWQITMDSPREGVWVMLPNGRRGWPYA